MFGLVFAINKKEGNSIHYTVLPQFQAVMALFISPFIIYMINSNRGFASSYDWQSLLLLLAIGICAAFGMIFMSLAFEQSPPQKIAGITYL